jgi:hypothetical protein
MLKESGERIREFADCFGRIGRDYGQPGNRQSFRNVHGLDLAPK